MTTEQPTTVRRKRHRLADPLLQLALAWVSAFLVGWPLIQIAGARGTVAMYLYVFATWSALIVLSHAVSRSLRRSRRADGSDDDPVDD